MMYVDILFSLLLTASVASTVILLVLLLIRRLFHKRLNPRIAYALWFLILVKMLVPVAPQSSVSLFNLMPQAIPGVWHSYQENGLPKPNSSSASDSSLNGPVNHHEANTLLSESIPSGTDQAGSAIVKPSPLDYTPVNVSEGLTWKRTGSLVWLGGLLLLGGYYLSITLKFRKSIVNSRRLANEQILSILESCKETLNIRSSIPVYETSRLRSPCLHGLWKPSIYLPEDMTAIADPDQLRHILLHELTHYKRKDLWFNSLWMLAIGLHWYNPAVWLAVKKIKADQEVACDAGVLEVLGERESSSYGMTLLMLSRLFSRGSSPRINLSPFFDNKNETKRRVTMIDKYKKGSYTLSAAAVLLILALSTVLLTSAADAPNEAGSGAKNHATNSNGEDASSLRIVRPIDSFKWFNRLERATDFAKFDFKVPDYLPEGYQLRNVDLNELFSKAHKADLLDEVVITFVSGFGKKDEVTIEVIASKGNGTMLEHQLLWGAPYSQQSATAPAFSQEVFAIGRIQGTLYTQAQGSAGKKGTGKSFVWQENGVSYAINYRSENSGVNVKVPQQRSNISQDELEKIVKSFVLPQHIQHVRYDGEGNSFPLYDESDLLDAKNILGFNVKLPFDLPDTGLKLADSTLLRAGDQNTGFSFRQASDALWNTYRVPFGSQIYDLNDELSLYQSKAPLFDTAKLSFVEKLEMNGTQISAYTDNNHVYYGPLYTGNGLDKTKVRSQTYYMWKQGDINYAAIFLGLDQYQEENLSTLVLAPLR